MFKNYLKIALKVLLRRKMFTFINLFGIGFSLSIFLAATTVFTLIMVSNPVQKNLSKTLFLKKVKFCTETGETSGLAAPYLIETCAKKLPNAKFVSFCTNGFPATIYINNNRIDIDQKDTDENYWKIFSYHFVEGCPYSLDEIKSGIPIVVICKSLKERIFGNTSAAGKSIRFNNKNYKISGVVNDVPPLYSAAYAQVWMPYDYAGDAKEIKEHFYFSFRYTAIIEFASSSDFEKAQIEFKNRIAKMKPPKDFKYVEAHLETTSEMIIKTINDNYNGTLFIAIALLISMLPVLNLTSLTISRIFERSSEIGVRKAFGATQKQLALQFVYENTVVTVIGGCFGFIGAWLLLKAIDASGLIQMGKPDFSPRVFLYGFAVILLFSIISGFFPAKKMSKLQITESLKGGK